MKLRYYLAIAITMISAVATYADDEEEVQYYPMILEYSRDSDIASMESQGIIVFRHRDNMALACVPMSLLTGSGAPAKRIKGVPGIRNIEPSRRAIPMMDEARTMYDADKIGTGDGLTAPYTGQGIVVGFCDTGFDPMHLNFLDTDGNTRVKRFVAYDELHGKRTYLDNQEDIAAFGSDTQETYHATHVAGILAGKCEGSPYTGMAPNADIVATTSDLYDVGMLAGAEDIIEYAKSVGKPCVINMSIGEYSGPHDGTTLFNRYLALLGQEALITMSAGNAGSSNGTMRCEFTDSKTNFRTRIHNMDWNQFVMYGVADCWSDDDTPFKAKILVLDEQAYADGTHDGSEIVYELPIADCSDDTSVYVSSDSDSEFAKYFTGIVALDGGYDSRSGRRYVTVQYSTTEEAVQTRGNWARYVLVIEVDGDPGAKVDVYCDNTYSRFTGFYGYDAPTSERAISNLATGDNIICVGMYNSRATLPQLGGDDISSGYTPGYVNQYSSYGTLVDGRVLPHTVAPGGGVISSYSSAFVQAYPDWIPSLCYKIEKDGNTYYWGNEVGTSMSAPYVAGCLATWLEANPSLSIDDVKKIIKDTNLTEYPNNPSDPRHGQGWFQPYAGIKAALALKGVGAGTMLMDTGNDVRLSYQMGTLTVWNPSGAHLQVDICNIQGMRVKSVNVNDTVTEISLIDLPKSVYLVRNSMGRSIKISL